MSLTEQKLPPIATLRAVAALKSANLALVRPARIGLGFEVGSARHKSLAQLEELLGGPGRLSLPYSLRLLLDVMAGLGTLHRALGFVHGEVNPEHVLLGEDGVGRLLPVVRAHWVRGEHRPATRLYYLSPEKLLGDAVDARSDVYSVGVLLWEALAGVRLLESQAVDDILARLMSGGVPRARAPEEESWTEPLSDIAARALSVDPTRRFSSIAEMKEAIEQATARYVASTPGMAELFQSPARRARGAARDSSAPDSQRITLPPHQAPATLKPRPASEPPPTPLVEKLSPLGLATYDLEEELTTKPNAAPFPMAAQRPLVSPFSALGGEAHDELTTPRARVQPSVPVLITPLPKPPDKPVTLATARAASRTATPVSFPAPPANPPPTTRVEPPSPQAVSLSPLVAARAEPPRGAAEPSFELVRPRRRRGALWLALGAAGAVAAFAGRPWLSRQLSATTAGAGAELPSAAPTPVPAPSATLPSADDASPVPRVAAPSSTAASRAAARAPTRGHAAREDHVVIQDTIDPSIQALREASPAKPEPPPPPPAPPPPEPPLVAPEPAKPKTTPASDADRYGI